MLNELTNPVLKLAAVDLDGTLLDANARMSADNAAALHRLMNAGLHVVLASGRHHINMSRYAKMTPGIEWIISCQGGEVANVERTTVLATNFLPLPEIAKVLATGRSLGFSTLAYRPEAVFSDSAPNDDMAFYTALAGTAPLPCSTEELHNHNAFKVLWVGTTERILHARELDPVKLPGTQMVQTHARILEFMPANVSKASGLSVLAHRLDIRPRETVAFGDGENDIPMFDWAGTSIAMPHGWPAALKRATCLAPDGPADTAFARGVDMILSGNHLATTPIHRPGIRLATTG